MNEQILQSTQVWTTADCMELLQELELAVQVLAKRVKKVMHECIGTLPQKLLSHMRDVGKQVASAFQVSSIEEYEQAAQWMGQRLAGMLYRLSGSFAGLKNAIVQAVSPIASLLVPVVQSAVEVLTGLVGSIGQVIRTLIWGTEDAQSFTTAVTGIGTAAKKTARSIAGFDQITRLQQAASAVGGTAVQIKPLTNGWKKLSQQILEYLKPLSDIDLSPAAQSLERLKMALEPITRALFAGLEWAWYNLLVPLAKWTVEELLPVFLDTLTAALQGLGYVIEELKPGFTWLWENFLKPLAQWAADQVIEHFKNLTLRLQDISQWMQDSQSPVAALLQSGKNMISTVAALAMEALGLTEAGSSAGSVFSRFLQIFIDGISPLNNTSTALGGVGQVLSALAECFGLVDVASENTWSKLREVWQSAWQWLKEKTLDPTYSGVRDTANGIIAFINSILRGAVTAVNFLSRALNGLKFDIPDWVPILGGKSFSFSLGQLTAPQIPYLAQGAVLPANKPFMAVVGDQKHGTNIEAPLSTIQEAVANVMGDMAGGMMAGFNALLEENRRLRAAVEGIEVGDTVIGQAAQRYARSTAIRNGGY